MASIYSKAPTFVDTSKSTLAVIDSYDKEMQRINQDYATAGKYAKDFKSKIDIIKEVDKEYFDEKYNSAVSQFSTGLDLTKRGQVGQVEGLLTSITNDETIINAVNSTKKLKKVMELRNELKTNPKYKNAHRPADEFAEQQAINSYLQSGKIGDSFALSGNIITMDTDKQIADIAKNIQYEEASTNFGPVNIHEKFKSPGKTIGAVYQGLVNSPQAIEAERNNFNYQYQTPEAQANFLNGVKSRKKEFTKLAGDRTIELTAALAATKNPLQITKINRELANIAQEKETLKNLDNAGAFEAYILNKAYTTGKSLEESKALKVEMDQYTKYFTDQGNKDRDFNYKVGQDAINNQFKAQKLAIDAAGTRGEQVDAEGNPIGDSSGFISSEGTVSFQELKNPKQELSKMKSELVLGNSKDAKELTQLLLDMPGTPLNDAYKDYKRRGLITDHTKGELIGNIELKNLLNLKQNFILNAGTPLSKEQQMFAEKLDNIVRRNEEYREYEQLEKIARDRTKHLSGEPNVIATSLVLKGLAPASILNTTQSKAYNSELAALIQSKNASKEVFIGDLNQTEDRKGNYNRPIRDFLVEEINKKGILSESKDRFGIAGITSGSQGGVFGDKTLSKSQMDSIDWENSIVAIIPKKEGSLVKLKLKSKEKDKSISVPEAFKNGYAYVEVPQEFAAAQLAKKGQSLGSFFDSKDKYVDWNAKNLSVKQKNDLIGKTLLDNKSLVLGNTRGYYEIEARSDNKYYINMNIAGTPVMTYTTRPTELFNKIEQGARALLEKMKAANKYTPQAYNKELLQVINEINRLNVY